MLEKLYEINWQDVQKGIKPIWIPNFIDALMSENSGIREKAYEDLAKQMFEGYKVGNNLAEIVIPFLIEIITFEHTPDKGLITSLLVELGSFDGTGEPYITRANRIRETVCKFRGLYISLSAEVSSSLQE